MSKQLELPFMAALKLKEVDALAFNEADLISIFEGACLAWAGLVYIDSWFELKDKRSDVVTEVLIFKDKDTGAFFRAERNQDNEFTIRNDIDRYEIGDEGEDVMVQLPEVKFDNEWVYV